MACKTYCVYKHALSNNKIYIGITKQNPLLRWKMDMVINIVIIFTMLF